VSSTDVLEKWERLIVNIEGRVADGEADTYDHCIRDLVVALRAEREKSRDEIANRSKLYYWYCRVWVGVVWWWLGVTGIRPKEESK